MAVKAHAAVSKSKRCSIVHPSRYTEEHFELFKGFKTALNRGEIRAAEPDADSRRDGGQCLGEEGNPPGFSHGRDRGYVRSTRARQPFFDKSTYPVQQFRRWRAACALCRADRAFATAAFFGRGVICMPPMFVNVGAYVGEGTMIDSHALVGTCAQSGQRLPPFRCGPDRGSARAGWRAAGDHRRRTC